MGLSLVGLESEAVIEWDKNACNTLRVNIQNEHALVRDWKVTEGDVRDFDFSQFQGRIDLLAGGPPCQPFSLGGQITSI